MRAVRRRFRSGVVGVGFALAGVLGVSAVSACGTQDGGAGSAGSGPHIVASFYPLQYATQRVLGDVGTVTGLTKPGAEPHDLELTPREVGAVASASLVVYLKGFQPSVDQAVDQEAASHAFDVAGPADLSLTYTPIEGGQAQAKEAGSVDPHFWLDPLRLAAVGDALAVRLGRLDPGHAAAFTANAAALHRDLQSLDAEYRAGLTSCANTELVTSHNAFGYLSQRYGLRQVGITGLTPEQEPNPAQLADVTAFVRSHHVRTIYYETLVSAKIADTVASETGARTEVLDPIEGLTDRSQGTDYLQVMRSNLSNLRTGQPCS